MADAFLSICFLEQKWHFDHFHPNLHDPKQSSVLCPIAAEKVLPVLGNVGTGLNIPDAERIKRVDIPIVFMLSTQSNRGTLLTMLPVSAF